MEDIADCSMVSSRNEGQYDLRTFVKAIHVQLSYKRRNICVLKILSVIGELRSSDDRSTYDKTLEKSLEGDITKLSAEFDHDIKCCMLWSSSMLYFH
jgi:hypothetical protein